MHFDTCLYDIQQGTSWGNNVFDHERAAGEEFLEHQAADNASLGSTEVFGCFYYVDIYILHRYTVYCPATITTGPTVSTKPL